MRSKVRKHREKGRTIASMEPCQLVLALVDDVVPNECMTIRVVEHVPVDLHRDTKNSYE